jgi:hypothetical protein
LVGIPLAQASLRTKFGVTVVAVKNLYTAPAAMGFPTAEVNTNAGGAPVLA